MRNLLREYPRKLLTVVTSDYEVRDLRRRGYADGLLDAPYVLVSTWRLNVRGLHRLLRLLNAAKIMVPTAIRLAWRASGDATILAVPYGAEYGSELFVAAYLAHRLSGAPLVVYEMDEWRSSLVGGGINGLISRTLERLFHRHILRSARTTWTMSEQMAKKLHGRFGVETKVLPACVEVDRYARGHQGQRASQGEFRLLFTGSIYTPQAGAIRNVLRAIQTMPDTQASLIIYSSQSEEEIAQQGVTGSRLSVERAVPIEEIPDVLATADALLLPFSFDNHQQAVVSTSLPSKTADYLASGVPILVHAPPYATVTRLARDGSWAAIVDVPSDEHLVAALRRLAKDEPFRKQLVRSALHIARSNYDLPTRRAEFVDSIRGES